MLGSNHTREYNLKALSPTDAKGIFYTTTTAFFFYTRKVLDVCVDVTLAPSSNISSAFRTLNAVANAFLSRSWPPSRFERSPVEFG